MVTMAQIEELGSRIGEEFHPERVLLFGSYAHGVPTDDSDVDVLVVLPFEGKAVHKSVEMRLRLQPAFPLDLLVRTPQEVQKRIQMGDDFMKEIVARGKVLYETPEP